MTDDEIRLLIRSAIARHLGTGVPPALALPGPPSQAAPATPIPMSFARHSIPRAPDDVMCIIEPEVTCNHCGYCVCHGH